MPQAEAQGGRRPRWTTIKVPAELKERVQSLGRKLGKPAWKVVLDSVSFFDAQISSPRLKERLPVVDKVSWYIVKAATSVSEFKINPTEENYVRMLRTLEQIETRLGVDTSILRRAAEAYMREPSVDNKMELNAALKMLVFDLIMDKIVEFDVQKKS